MSLLDQLQQAFAPGNHLGGGCNCARLAYLVASTTWQEASGVVYWHCDIPFLQAELVRCKAATLDVQEL